VIGRAREVEGEKKDGSVVRIRLSISKITIQDEVFYCGLIEALEDKTGFVTSDDKGVRCPLSLHNTHTTHNTHNTQHTQDTASRHGSHCVCGCLLMPVCR